MKRVVGISFGIVLVIGSIFGLISLSTRILKPANASDNTPLTPHQTEVYFLMERANCLAAYVPEGSICVSVKIQSDITKPYIEVPRLRESDFGVGLGKREFIAWGLNGTLFVKDTEQLKGLFLLK